MEALCSSFLPTFHASNVRLLTYEKKQPRMITRMVKGGENPPSLAKIFKSLDDFVSRFMDLPLRPYNDPKHVLSGNFAPVDELPPTPCEVVEGSLPPLLNGAYIRVGPNPQFMPHGPCHYTDGDGMLHSIKISEGQAVFCSRYVKTHKYMVERGLGYPIVPSIFSSFNGFMASMARIMLLFARVITRQLDPITNGFGVANTNVTLFAGQLFALWEADLPYALKMTAEGDIITLGRHDFGSDPNLLSCMTAHPKVDPDTGEVFAFRCTLIRPFLTYFRINPSGVKQKEVPVLSLQRPSLIHDFAVTKNYAIFPDTQILLKATEVIKGRTPLAVDLAKAPRLGIIPRFAEDESQMWWIDVPGLNMMHTVNAWEENNGNRIVIVASNVISVADMAKHMNFLRLSLERITIDVKAKKVERHQLSTKNLDVGVINPVYSLKKCRYIYAAIVEGTPKVEGVVKIDLSVPTTDFVVASRVYAPGCYGGELTFVPREPNNPEAEEDDGYLVTYVHDENSKESKFLVMDAKSPTLEIIATVRLPHRVPYGFHGIFVPDNQLKNLSKF